MSDMERVFALYVQANPVPEPDLLPATRDEATLPTIEGSTIMDTTERVETRPPQRVRRWRPALVVGAAFIVVLGIVGGAFLLTGDGNGEPVAAADARPVVTFDGESCTYQGPTRITNGDVEFTFVNDAARDVMLGIWGMSGAALAAELERTPVGTDMALMPDDPVPNGNLTAVITAHAGQSTTGSDYLTAGPTGGTYLIDCVTSTAEYDDHVWRVAAIEVVKR